MASKLYPLDTTAFGTVPGIFRRASVKDKDLSAPPGSPAEGDRYIVKATGTGLWAGHNTHIAEWHALSPAVAAWIFIDPWMGLRAWVEDETTDYEWNGTAWVKSAATLRLDDLSNVTITGLTSGDTVTWNGAAWVNTPNATTDEKVKAEATDPTAGYLDAKVDNSTIEAYATTHVIRVKDAGITYAKIQNISATDKVLGRASAGAGVTEEIACTAAGRAILDDANAGAQRTTLGVGTGDTPTFNGIVLTGALTGNQVTVEPHTEGVGAPHVLAAADCGKVITNEGASALQYQTLPTAVANLQFTFYCQDGDGIRIDAANNATIRIGSNVSPANGNVSSTTVGSAICLIAINNSEWVAILVTGTWSVST